MSNKINIIIPSIKKIYFKKFNHGEYLGLNLAPHVHVICIHVSQCRACGYENKLDVMSWNLKRYDNRSLFYEINTRIK